MTTKRLVVLLIVAMAGVVGVARARRAAAVEPGGRTFDVAGVVTAPAANGLVTIAHAAIPGYMPAMTMPFAIGRQAPALEPGDRVRFTLTVAADRLLAENIVVVGRDEAVAAAARDAKSVTPLRLKKGDMLPAFSLTAQDGRPFTDADLRGRLTAVTFIFSRCPVPEFCPLMSSRFRQLQGEVQRDPALGLVQLLSVTLDPAFDTPSVLDAYAKAKGADPDRWRFVTGDPAQVDRLTRAFSIHTERNGVLLDHTLATAVVDTGGRIVQIWRGTGWNTTELLTVLRQEAAKPSR